MTAKAATKPIYTHLYVQVLIGITIGVALGYFWPGAGAAMKPLGDGFIRLIRMIIAPIIFGTVVVGIAKMGDMKSVGRIGIKALVYFEIVSTIALLIGLVIINLLKPGVGINADPATLDANAVAAYTSNAQHLTTIDFLLNIIPSTIVDAFAKGEILQVLLFSVLFGLALLHMGGKSRPLVTFFEDCSHALFGVVGIIMRVAPIGAFGAMAFTIGQYGIGTIVNLAQLVLTFYATALLFVVVVLGLVARLAGFSIFALIRYLKDELLLVLGTSSSESAMPLLMEKMEAAGVPKPIVGLVVPTGYSFNLDGTCIYMSLAALFIAQATNAPLSFGDELLLMAVAILSSKGAAGVTGSGFIVLAATLSVVPAIPVAGMALILGVDRFMSECRSLTNFIGNAVATIVVGRWEGSVDMERLRRTLATARGEPTDAEVDRIQLQR